MYGSGARTGCTLQNCHVTDGRIVTSKPLPEVFVSRVSEVGDAPRPVKSSSPIEPVFGVRQPKPRLDQLVGDIRESRRRSFRLPGESGTSRTKAKGSAKCNRADHSQPEEGAHDNKDYRQTDQVPVALQTGFMGT